MGVNNAILILVSSIELVLLTKLLTAELWELTTLYFF
jgi:hypothetical protein